MTQIFAHRGSAGTHPENTMSAFIEAERVGSDGLEFDAQMTKDGEIVVIHDERVDRTTDGHGWVKDFTLKELKQLDAGSHVSKRFRSEKIPTLKELLDWVQGKGLRLNIELKTGLIPYPDLERRVIRMIQSYGLKDRVILSSFNHDSIKRIIAIDPAIETAILFMEGLFEPWKYAKSIGAAGLHCYRKAAVPEMIAGAKKAGVAIRPFTVNDRREIKSFIKAGCTGVFTDFPRKAIRIRDEVNEAE